MAQLSPQVNNNSNTSSPPDAQQYREQLLKEHSNHLIQQFYKATDDDHNMGLQVQGEGIVTECTKWIIFENPETDECPICIEPHEGAKLWTRTKCGHIFHTECLMDWTKGQLLDKKYFRSKAVCPVCRQVYLNMEPYLGITENHI